MSARIAAGVLVSALIRRAEAAGGSAMVLAKGDATSGAILVAIAARGITTKLLERTMNFDGGYELRAAGPASFEDPSALSDYIARRRRSDPDIWVVEIDAADAEAIAAELLGGVIPPPLAPPSPRA